MCSETNVDKSFVIIIPSYNNAKYCKRNLDSIFAQSYPNYRVVYIDDASTDGNGELVKEYFKRLGNKHQASLIQNKERAGGLANYYHAIMASKKNEIIVAIDGDDWLPDNDVLAYLNEVYSDPNVWLTYGQFITYPDNALGFAQEVPKSALDNNDLRKIGGMTHLRTFYAGLFHRIKKEDLLYNGEFYPMAWDTAFLLPLFEMSGRRAKFISRIMYVYNRENPISDDRVNRELQHKLDLYIRSKEPYARINEF